MILDLFATQPYNKELSLLDLSWKMVVLLLLSTRKQPSEIVGYPSHTVSATEINLLLIYPSIQRQLTNMSWQTEEFMSRSIQVM